MSKYFVEGQDLTDIADAIREGLATTESLEFPDDFINGIEDLGGGITPSGEKTINVSANGTTTTDVTNYVTAKVVAAVPNTYGSSDEGKVVSSGALVAQTSDSTTSNGTFDTTLINSFAVNVSGGITPTGTKQINVTSNGTTTTDVTAYASAEVIANVPNTYSSGDEGKVVYNGALVAQTSGSVSADGTYDTTLINSMTVSTGGGGGGTTMYTGTYEPSTMPTANVPFSCAGATNFLIRVADTATINTGTGHAYFYLIYASTSKTSQFGSNNGGTAISNGTDRYTTGARNGTSPGVQFTADGVELIYYNSTSYRWVQAGLTYNWYAW